MPPTPPTPSQPIVETPKGSLTPAEVFDKFPALIAIFQTVMSGIQEAKIDGKVTCEELGTVLGAVMRPLGRLVDEVIADLND